VLGRSNGSCVTCCHTLNLIFQDGISSVWRREYAPAMEGMQSGWRPFVRPDVLCALQAVPELHTLECLTRRLCRLALFGRSEPSNQWQGFPRSRRSPALDRNFHYGNWRSHSFPRMFGCTHNLEQVLVQSLLKETIKNVNKKKACNRGGHRLFVYIDVKLYVRKVMPTKNCW
jgi:hypothetical protein